MIYTRFGSQPRTDSEKPRTSKHAPTTPRRYPSNPSISCHTLILTAATRQCGRLTQSTAGVLPVNVRSRVLFLPRSRRGKCAHGGMAEAQADSSRVSAGMIMSFAIASPTNTNLDGTPPRDLQHWPSAARNPRRSSMQGDYAVSRDTVPHPGDNVAFISGDNRERGHPAVSGNRLQASSHGTPRAPTPLLAGADRDLGLITTAEATAARDSWSHRGGGSHCRGRRERDSQHAAEHAATSRGGFQSTVCHSAYGVASVATVGRGSQGSSDGVPLMCAVRRAPGGARDTRRARPRKGRAEKPCDRDDDHQHFGVKRIRPVEGIDNRDEEQGDEGRRMSSPHRLIRRNGVVASPNSTRNIPQAGSMPRQSAGLSVRSSSFAVGTVPNLGIASHTSRRSPRHSTPLDVVNSPAMREGGGQSENSIGSVTRTDREAASGEIGEGAPHSVNHQDVRTPNEASLSADSTWIADGSSSTGLRCRPRHRSLKVQRLNTSPMESLTSGVRSLGVMSPATPPPDFSDVNVDHHGSDGAPATNTSFVRGMAMPGEARVENMVPAVQPPLSRAPDSALGVRSVGARAGELVDDGHAAFHVPSR